MDYFNKSTISMKFRNEYQEKDLLTGEVVVHKESYFTKSKTEEPRFVKLFVDDIGALQNLSLSSIKVLHIILKEMNYNNVVNLVLETKNDISTHTGMSIKHIEKAIMELKNKDILNTRGRASYVVNPILFGKGDWNNINSVKMTIKYDEKGKMIDVIRLKKSKTQD